MSVGDGGAVAAVAAATRSAPIAAAKPGRKVVVASVVTAAEVAAGGVTDPKKRPAAKPVWQHAKSVLRVPSVRNGASAPSAMKPVARTRTKAARAVAVDRVAVGANVRTANPA